MATGQLIDAAIVLAYLILSFAAGIYASKLLKTSSQGEEGYFLAGKKMPGWLAGTSVAVTSMNADVAPAYAGMAIVIGLPVAWFYLSRFGLALMIAAILFAYLWRRMGINTAPSFYSLRFGGRGGTFVRVWTALWSTSIGMVPWIGAGLLGVHKIFGPIYGIESKAFTLAIILPVLLFYVWISGYAGVLITDLIQSVIIIFANIVLAFLVLYHFGGAGGFSEAITTHMGEASSDILSSFPVPGHQVLGPLAVLIWFVIPTIGYGGNMHTEGQRIFSCKNAKESMKSFIWSEGVLFLMLLTLTLPVLGLLPSHPELYLADAGEREKAYGMLMNTFLPVGLKGLALAALLASVMSTIDSHLNYGAQIITHDVARVFRPGLSERSGIFIGRISSVAILSAAIVVVYNSDSLIKIAITLAGLFGATVTFNWAQWWWWRTNFPAWISAMVVGPFIYLLLGPILSRMDWWINYAETGGPAASEILGLVQAIAGMLVSTFTWITVALVTAPENMETLKAFYIKARPMGVWGPVRRAIEQDQGPQALPAQKTMIVPGFAVAILGTAWISAAVLVLSNLYVAKYLEAGILLLATAVGALLFKKAFAWYFERLENQHGEEGQS